MLVGSKKTAGTKNARAFDVFSLHNPVYSQFILYLYLIYVSIVIIYAE